MLYFINERLWGDHGQSSLENSSVCLINATATGTETLKSLVLPGIGSFTIVDGAVISGEDAGNKLVYFFFIVFLIQLKYLINE